MANSMHQSTRQQVNFDYINHSQLSIGLTELQAHCSSVYPDVEPLCLRPSKSFFKEGGQDPLDFIYIYQNEQDSNRGLPQHWHYVGFGLSDIHNYQMLYQCDKESRLKNPYYAQVTPELVPIYPPRDPSLPKISGFGIELSFRIMCNSQDDWIRGPPKWPGHVMQDLARYIYQSKNVFNVGDHAAWHGPLDEDESKIEHMLMTLDPQLGEIETSLGKVKFIQLVGVFKEELQQAREWNVRGILNIMKNMADLGGDYLVTDMRRDFTIFQHDPENLLLVKEGIAEMGSDMAMMSAMHRYDSREPQWYKEVKNFQDSCNEDRMDECQIEPGRFMSMNQDETRLSVLPERNASRMSYESESALMIENAELLDTRYYDNIYLLLNLESAKVLPVVLNGRLAHKKHFSFQRFKGDLITTFVPEGASNNTIVTKEQRYARRGTWLQLYIPEQLRLEMSNTIGNDFDNNIENDPNLPKNYSWPEFKFHITVEAPENKDK